MSLRPLETLRPEGLQCRAWQTKTDRSRRCTQLVVCRASLGGNEWRRYGFECWKSHTPATYHLEDFFLFESDGNKADFGRPITYAAFVDNLRSMSHKAVSTYASDEDRSDLLDVISKVTAHSMRCTITSAMAHHSFEHQSIHGEENELSNLVPEGVDPFASGDRRDQLRSEADVCEDVGPQESEVQMQIGGVSLHWASFRALEHKKDRNIVIHCSEGDEQRLVCNIMPILACTVPGSALPDLGRLCDKCLSRIF